MHILFEEGRSDWVADFWEDGERTPTALGAGTGASLHVPQGPGALAAHYDLTISHPRADMDAFRAFDRWLAESAAARGLSCALLHDGVVHEAIQRLDRGLLTIGFHLDYFSLWHSAGDPYARLACAVQDSGGQPINPPARARTFTDKATAHAELVRRGLGVPATVVLRPWIADRHLTPAERARLHLDEPEAQVFIKPANGFGGRGVHRGDRTDPESLLATLSAARNHDRGDTFLIQRALRPPRLLCEDGVERLAYWRILYCLRELIPFWWNQEETHCGRPSYRRLTPPEIKDHRLGPVLRYVSDLAELSGLQWFSSEVCLSAGAEPSRYIVRCPGGGAHTGCVWSVVAVDYINDQCDVDVQSRWPGAPPDAVVHHLAERFAAAAWQQRELSKQLRWAA